MLLNLSNFESASNSNLTKSKMNENISTSLLLSYYSLLLGTTYQPPSASLLQDCLGKRKRQDETEKRERKAKRERHRREVISDLFTKLDKELERVNTRFNEKRAENNTREEILREVLRTLLRIKFGEEFGKNILLALGVNYKSNISSADYFSAEKYDEKLRKRVKEKERRNSVRNLINQVGVVLGIENSIDQVYILCCALDFFTELI